jgi:hypothetical protein
MPSPLLEQRYHHPSSIPTPSNPEFKNTGPSHSLQICCGLTFHSDAEFKAHFADKHDPKSANYVMPEDHNKKAVIVEGAEAAKPATLASRGYEPLVPESEPKTEKAMPAWS